MSKSTIVLLQESRDTIEKIEKDFANDEEFEIIASATDGISAINLIAEKKPDIVITEVILSGYDGLSVIEKLKEMKSKSKIVVLSSFTREEVITKCTALGAEYFMVKPYRIEILKGRLKEIVKGEGQVAVHTEYERNIHVTSLEEKISKIFINVGIPPHIKGYSFLREGVKMAVAEPEIINNITKKLYPSIGEKYQTSASKVERAIRHAIEVAWNRGRIETINNILGVRAYVGAEKPTNGEFIALVADKMLLERS
jgi:two-component system response regulator (stage 0 sporulation protein A)